MGESKRRKLAGLPPRARVEGGFDELDAQDPVGRMFIVIADRLIEHREQGHVIEFVEHRDLEDGSIDVEIRCGVCLDELPICFLSEELANHLQAALIADGEKFEVIDED